jgi:4-diphosphocytidyl-2-C-methyl-D-erythritol kinase
MASTALAEGIGEQLSPLPPMPPCHILIAKPGISVSTKFVYDNLDTQAVSSHPPIDDLIQALSHQDLPFLAASMGNVLEQVTIPHYPEIAVLKETMLKYGALNAMMSGSGPTVFGLFLPDKLAQAKAALKALRSQGIARQTYLTTPYNPERKQS